MKKSFFQITVYSLFICVNKFENWVVLQSLWFYKTMIYKINLVSILNTLSGP